MATRSRKSPLRNGAPLLLGVALSLLLAHGLWLGGRPVDWRQRAADLLAEMDYAGSIEASTRWLEQHPADADVLFMRCQALNAVRLWQRALADIDAALVQAPGSPQFTTFKSMLLAALGRHAEAVELLDETAKSLGRSWVFKLHAARARLRYAASLRQGLLGLLDRYHPERLLVRERLDAHHASPDERSAERRALLAGLPGDDLTQRIAADLDLSWRLLREADKLLGDTRAVDQDLPLAFLTRAELDLRLGRLLAAKENVQTLLRRGLDVATWRQALELLAEVLDRLEAHAARARCLQQTVELQGGGSTAPLPRLADVLEAEFKAAEADPALRARFLEAADRHLERYRGTDMRTLGYRGVAALEWAGDHDLAVKLLFDTYEALTLNQGKDESILAPERAQRFMAALLQAYLKSGQIGRGLAVANTLLELAPLDPNLLRLRALILKASGSAGAAALDLRDAKRFSPRDPALFDLWLKTASLVRDAQGRTPFDLALEVADQWRATKNAFMQELESQGNYFEVGKFRQSPQRVSDRLSLIAEYASSMAQNPVVAWLMAEEFGRQGETVEARKFLFQAANAEPRIMEFRHRLGQYRLDLGMYETAAEDFEAILERDPTDAPAARAAAKCWQLAGDSERARAVRQRIIQADPVRAGLQVCVQAALERGDFAQAWRMLEPHQGREESAIQALLGQLLLALGSHGPAAAVLEQALAQEPENPEVLRDLILARALAGQRGPFNELAGRFVDLPRLLPAADIEDMLARLEQAGQPAAAAFIADRVAERYADASRRRLKSRAALDALRGGDTSLLRPLRGDPRLCAQLDNDLVRAAFGLTLREEGPEDAADFLQKVREYTDERDWALLPTAAAWALTSNQDGVNAFLGRHQKAQGERPIPAGEALLWWATYGRLDKKLAEVPELARGSEGEMDWLGRSRRTVKDGGQPLDELYLYFLLFDFAGPGFEADAERYAARIAALDRRALTPARFLARRLRERSGAAAAAQFLLDKYQALPNDYPTFLLLGELVREADPGGSFLALLAQGGGERFPDRVEPLLFGASAALSAGQPQAASALLDQALALDPANGEAQHLLARLALEAGASAAGGRLARIAVEHGLADPELRSSLVRWLGTGAERREIALPVLGELLRKDPTFYGGACALAVHLAWEKRDAELAALAERTTAAIPADPGAARAGKDIRGMVAMLEQRGMDGAARALIDAALFADPSDCWLRQRRADLLIRAGLKGAAIEDLRVLCVLAPRDPEMLFRFGELLLEERTDLAGVLIALIPALKSLAGDDPRFHALLARDLFRRDDIEGAAAEYRLAVEGAPADLHMRYQYGLMCFLLDRDAEARQALEAIPATFEFAARVKQILRQLQAPR
ncbi:MAG: hypothetical protein HY812_04665 [Planctomycetes bacterium]|nr:hypothetical protein [Planctomycetota bacterium]